MQASDLVNPHCSPQPFPCPCPGQHRGGLPVVTGEGQVGGWPGTLLERQSGGRGGSPQHVYWTWLEKHKCKDKMINNFKRSWIYHPPQLQRSQGARGRAESTASSIFSDPPDLDPALHLPGIILRIIPGSSASPALPSVSAPASLSHGLFESQPLSPSVRGSGGGVFGR